MTTGGEKSLWSAIERRFPKVLVDELSWALGAAEQEIPDLGQLWEMLSRFRRNRARCIAAWGLKPDGRPVDGLKHIPIKYDSILRDLDSALAKLRQYGLHPEDYASAKVAEIIGRALQSKRASRPRKRKERNRYEEIGEFLSEELHIEYAEHGQRKGMLYDASQKFNVSERTIHRAVDHCNLSKNSTE